jgi:hypothetical protein
MKQFVIGGQIDLRHGIGHIVRIGRAMKPADGEIDDQAH